MINSNLQTRIEEKRWDRLQIWKSKGEDIENFKMGWKMNLDSVVLVIGFGIWIINCGKSFVIGSRNRACALSDLICPKFHLLVDSVHLNIN